MKRLICAIALILKKPTFIIPILALSQSSTAQNINKELIQRKIAQYEDSIHIYVESEDYENEARVFAEAITFMESNNYTLSGDYSYFCLNYAILMTAVGNDYEASTNFYKAYTTCVKTGEETILIDSAIEAGQKMEIDLPFLRVLAKAKNDESIKELLNNDPNHLVAILNGQAIKNIDEEQYLDAIKLYEEELSILDATQQIGTDDYLSILSSCSTYALLTGDIQLSFKYTDLQLHLSRIVFGENSREYADALLRLSDIEDQSLYADSSIVHKEEALAIYKEVEGELSFDYINTLYQLSISYSGEKGDLSTARRLIQQAVELSESSSNIKWNNACNYYIVYSDILSRLGDYKKAILYAQKAVDNHEKHGDSHSMDYATSLNNMSACLAKNHEFDRALDYSRKTIDIISSLGQEQTKLGRLLIDGHARILYETGKYDEGIKFLEPILQNSPDDNIKLAFLGILINLYLKIDKKEDVDRLVTQRLNITEKIFGKESSEYADALFFASSTHESTGEKVQLIQQALSIIEKTEGKNSKNYLDGQYILSLLLGQTNDLQSQYDELMEFIESTKKQYGENSRQYIQAKLRYYTFFEQIGTSCEEKSALFQYVENLSNQIKNSDSDFEDLYIESLSLLSTICSSWFNCDQDSTKLENAIKYDKQVAEWKEKTYGQDHFEYISSLENLAFSLSRNQKFEDAISIQNKAIAYYKKQNPEGKNYISSLNKLSHIYLEWADSYNRNNVLWEFQFFSDENDKNRYEKEYVPCLEKGIEVAKESVRLSETYLNDQDCLLPLMYLSRLYEHKKEDISSLETDYNRFNHTKAYLVQELSMLTSEEKNNGLNQQQWEQELRSAISNMAYKGKRFPIANSQAFDALLFYKGLLLSSEISLRELIIESKDEKAISLYNNIYTLKEEQKALEVGSPSYNDARKKISSMERDLLSISSTYGQYMNSNLVSWKDVQSHLKKNEVAIEFVKNSLPFTDGQNDKYYALVITRDSDLPSRVELCEERELLNSDSLYHKIWLPLDSLTNLAKNVYFSPHMTLNNLAIENVIMPNGKKLSGTGKKYYRLSSTRELLNRKDRAKYKSAAVYGGLVYKASKSSFGTSRGMNFQIIPGSEMEMEEVSEMLKKGLNTSVFSGLNGTEESFRNLNGKRTDIIHLATHGFYIPSNIEPDMDALQRSGLAFSGANENNPSADSKNNGIMTAEEISKLDLRGLDLVVLSACESGLGDISNEGVFGLQRGFKKAGAQSLLMTLWKINDTATFLFMQRFYEYFLAGDSKLVALEKAQEYLRKYNNGEFSDPQYWAGFILLDGLN